MTPPPGGVSFAPKPAIFLLPDKFPRFTHSPFALHRSIMVKKPLGLDCFSCALLPKFLAGLPFHGRFSNGSLLKSERGCLGLRNPGKKGKIPASPVLSSPL